MLSAAKHPGPPGGESGPRGCFAAAAHDTSRGVCHAERQRSIRGPRHPLGHPRCFAVAQHDTSEGLFYGMPWQASPDVSCWAAAKHLGRRLVGRGARAQASCAPTNHAGAPLVRGW